MGREGVSFASCEIDLRVGGSYRYVMQMGDQQIVMRGDYLELEPPHRMVSTEGFEGFGETGWRPEDATVSTLELVEEGGFTHMTLTSLYPSTEVRDQAYNLKPAWEGFESSLAQLERVALESAS
jgi:uncharacterized protein YndB with AHSA1/START domain